MEEYKFPDEQEVKAPADEKVEFEVQSEEKEPEPIVEVAQEEKPQHTKLGQTPKEPDDKELSEYSDRVKQRINHLYKGYQTEKRRAEAIAAEREEAVRMAQAMLEENKRLKGSLSQGQTALIEQAKKVVSNELEEAKRQFKDAYESGDGEGMTKAQERLAAATVKLERVNNLKPAPLQEEEKEVQTSTAAVERPRADPKAVAWKTQNQWFGEDEEMTSFALGYHAKLLKQGVDPNSDEYYEKLNSRLRQVFPESFDAEEPPEQEEKPVERKKSNVVAPATRSTAPKKIVLTQTQVSIAKRLGVPLEAYARQVAEQMRKQNG